MKLMSTIAALMGLALGTAIIGYYGFGSVASALFAIGWGGFAALCGYHFILFGILGSAWSSVLPPSRRIAVRAFIWGRLIRDSGSEVLPLSQIGGIVMGARAATLAGVPPTVAYASTVADVTLEVIAQIAYVVLGLLLLLSLKPQSTYIYPVAIGVGVSILAIASFIAVQHYGFAPLQRLASRSALSILPKALSRMAPVHATLRAIYRYRPGLARGVALHFVAWVGSGVEGYFALHLMGVGLGIGAILAIESLLYAIRSIAFAVPNAAGVQEGAYVVLGGLFGLAPETMLALSLFKRARDVVIGVPALVIWQALEGNRLWRRKEAVDERALVERDAERNPTFGVSSH
jgi:putative membrane protein